MTERVHPYVYRSKYFDVNANFDILTPEGKDKLLDAVKKNAQLLRKKPSKEQTTLLPAVLYGIFFLSNATLNDLEQMFAGSNYPINRAEIETIIGQQIEADILSQETDKKGQETKGVSRWLQNLWQRDYGQGANHIPLVESKIRWEYLPYPLYTHDLVTVINWLHRFDKLPRQFDKYFSNGRLNDIHLCSQADEIASQQILDGVSICVVGGHEGRIFSAFGADTRIVDPNAKAFAGPFPHLTFDPRLISSVVASESPNTYDVIYSNLLLEKQGTDENLVFDDYNDIFNACLTICKPNGFNIHRGGLIPSLCKANASRLDKNTLGIIDTVGDLSPLYVIGNKNLQR